MDKVVAIIGTGRLGNALALGLWEAGYEIKYLSSKPKDSAISLSRKVGGKPIEAPFSEMTDANLIFLTVPDDAISAIAAELTEKSGLDWGGKTVIHCAGALTVEVLKPLKALGAEVLSFHPLQNFPPGCSSERFKGIYFTIEGDDYSVGEQLAEDLDGLPLRLKSEQKVLYHTAACIASNYLFALAGAAGEVLKSAGIEFDDASKVLFPLMQGTLNSLGELGIKDGLTGPIARGDIETVRKHIDQLEGRDDLQDFYRYLGLWLLKYAEIEPEIKDRFSEIFKKKD